MPTARRASSSTPSSARQGERVERIAALADDRSRPAVGADRAQAGAAAHLAKADLVTGMVGEFPELQGVMGRYYALHDGETGAVADAIRDHYAPRGAGRAVPAAPVSIAVALADKLDPLAGFFAIGEKPTGSGDPYALRRAALGVIRIIRENGLRLPPHAADRGGGRRVFRAARPHPVEPGEILALSSPNASRSSCARRARGTTC